MSHLVQLLLPLQDNDHRSFPEHQFKQIQQELKEKFGGVTAYTRSPAEGQWCNDGTVWKDDIVIYEVMVSDLEPLWWENYRQQLERRFGQDQLIIRALSMQRL